MEAIVGGVAGGKKFVANGMFFKFARYVTAPCNLSFYVSLSFFFFFLFFSVFNNKWSKNNLTSLVSQTGGFF